MSRILLLQPPPGDLTGPYPALPYLKAYAQEHGLQVQVRDLGLEAFYYLSQPQRLQAWLDQAWALQRQVQGRRFLSLAAVQQQELLAQVWQAGLSPATLSQAVAIFKNFTDFYDYPRYLWAKSQLDAFFALLSALHWPTRLTAADYPSARQLGDWPAIWRHLDPAVNPYLSYYEEVLLPEIAAAPPPLIGISVVFGTQTTQALVLARLLKERLPQSHITLGGAYLSQWLLLLDDDRLATLYNWADSFIVGEGEEALTALAQRLLAGRELSAVPNLYYRDPASGRLHRCPTLGYPDLTQLPPPDYSDLDLSAYLTPRPVIPYAISRGCYWGRCVFCQNRYGDQQLRRYQTVPVTKALTEISALLQRYQTDQVNFSNDAIDPGYLKNFAREVLAARLQCYWYTDLRAEAAFDRETCRLLAAAGLRSVAIGLESACPKVLQAMQKGTDFRIVRQVLKWLYDAGVATQVMGIFGFPGETEKDGLLTVKFLEDNLDRISYYVMGLLLVLPGSRLYREPAAFGITEISYADNPLRLPEPVWRSPRRMSAVAVQRLYQRLSRLEEVFELNDYPYVGALSTNHSFLYFLQGPDILKRLKRVVSGAEGRQPSR